MKLLLKIIDNIATSYEFDQQTKEIRVTFPLEVFYKSYFGTPAKQPYWNKTVEKLTLEICQKWELAGDTTGAITFKEGKNLIHESRINFKGKSFAKKHIDAISNYLQEQYENRPKVLIASKSQIKLEAARTALNEFTLFTEPMGYEMCSYVPNQPIGLEEIRNGAQNRANGLLRMRKNKHIISVENGIIELQEANVDLAVVIVIDELGRQVTLTSEPVTIPREYWDEYQKSCNQEVTFGAFLATKVGSNPTDPHSWLTNGVQSRQSLLEKAIIDAIRLHETTYQKPFFSIPQTE